MKTAKESSGEEQNLGEGRDVGVAPEAQEDIFQRGKGETRKDFEICGWITMLETWGEGRGMGWVLVIVHWLSIRFLCFSKWSKLKKEETDSGET